MSKKKDTSQVDIEDIIRDLQKERKNSPEYKIWVAREGRWVPFHETEEFDKLMKENTKIIK